MSTQPAIQIETIPFKSVPLDVRMREENRRIYRVAVQLKRMRPDSAMRIRLNDLDPIKVQRCVHRHFRADTRRVRTRVKDGYIYLWLEDKSIVAFSRADKPKSNA